MPQDLGLPLPVTSGPSGSSSPFNNTAYPPTPLSNSFPPPPASTSSLRQTALEKLTTFKGKGKGKGKVKALYSPLSNDDQEEEREGEGEEEIEGPKGLSFSIRFTAEGVEDLLDLWVGEGESVREVKRRIRYLRPSLTLEGRPRRLRLIQLGRVLTDGTSLVDYTVKLLSRRAKLVNDESKTGTVAFYEELEAVSRGIGVEFSGGSGSLGSGESEKDEKEKGKGKGKDMKEWKSLVGTEAEDDQRVWLHCSVGEAMEDDEIEGERIQAIDQITPLQGFDRLRDAGFSETEINEMRAEFRSTNANASALVEGDDAEHIRALEDQWMEGLTQNQVVDDPSTASGVYMTLLQGVCISFFFPFLPLFFFRTQVFSKRLQMSIVLGIW